MTHERTRMLARWLETPSARHIYELIEDLMQQEFMSGLNTTDPQTAFAAAQRAKGMQIIRETLATISKGEYERTDTGNDAVGSITSID